MEASLIRHNFPLDADYQFSVKLLRNIVGYMTGLEFAHQLEISVDGERVFIAPVGGPEDNMMSDENMSEAADKIDERLKTRIAVKAGPRTVGVTFLRKSSAESDEPLQPFTRDHDLQNMNGIPLDRLRRHPGTVRGHRSGRYAEPSPHLCLPACIGAREEAAVRQKDPLDAGAARLSAAGHRR